MEYGYCLPYNFMIPKKISVKVANIEFTFVSFNVCGYEAGFINYICLHNVMHLNKNWSLDSICSEGFVLH